MSNYIFYKDGSLQRPKNISSTQFNQLQYGDEIIGSFEVSCSIKIYNKSGSNTTPEDPSAFIKSLTNIISYYSGSHPLYSVDNFTGSNVCFVAIPSLIVGSGLQKGSVQLNYYTTGNLAASASDSRQDGVLYSGDSAIGIVLYKEGFILINHTGSVSSTQDKYFNDTFDNARWVYWGINTASVTASSFDIDFKTISYTPTITLFAHASKYDLNHSNNNTFISSSNSFESSSNSYVESKQNQIKNVVKSPFISGSADFEKETYITKIGLYDKNKKLVAVASLANPVRKTENREFTFKLKMDL